MIAVDSHLMSTANVTSGPSQALIEQILAGFDRLSGLHPGYRPAHAKGTLCLGTFNPSLSASTLTRAPHASQAMTLVVVRFSDFAGVPTVADNDPQGASPRGFAARFYLGDHVHTDIIGHSANGFPTRTGEEFLEFLHAVAASGPDVPHPNPIESFLGSHPAALRFVQMPKPIPTSFAKEAFFGVSALKFTNDQGETQFGRFHIVPEAGTEYLDAAAAAAKSSNFLFDELGERLAAGPIKLRIVVQLAEVGDDVADATVPWPESRPALDFGTITLTKLADNDDPEMRKIIFDPIPRVDGIDPSDDPLLAVRAAIYLMSGRRRRAADVAK
jgi:catalase